VACLFRAAPLRKTRIEMNKERAITRHLDLGCGGVPRNPYRRDELHGVDLVVAEPSERFKSANLSLHPIPFADNHFHSVSAYDFLEHVPRVLPTRDGLATRAPFVELMDEIWRVLVPGGLLYAVTPAYPHVSVFQDPTHVNVLTDGSHIYFTQPKLLGRIYGFRGTFIERRVEWVVPKGDYESAQRSLIQRVRRRLTRHTFSHLIWEFEAVK
jgi:SAM-dependent methyltransferase